MDSNFNFIEFNLPLMEHFSLGFNSHSIPLKSSPERINNSITFFCTKGSAEVEIDFIRYKIKKGSIITVLPLQVVEIKFVSSDFSIIYFTCSQEMLDHIFFRFPPEFIMFLKENPVYNSTKEIFESDMDFLHRLKIKYDEVNNICQGPIIIHMVRIHYLEVFNIINNEIKKGMIQHSRKTEIMKEFSQLLMKNYRESREVQFYAERMNLTPKYLSYVTNEIYGMSAKKYIDNFTITEIKLFIKASSKSFQEVAELFNFTDQSFFTKYFKHHTNQTPKEYRR